MIDIQTEQLLTLQDAAKSLPRRPHVATVYRWISAGVRGVRLEAVRVGGVLYTSREKLQFFAERCTDPTITPSRTTPKARQNEIDRAERELGAVGI